ncbi:pyridoxamine 5'-phosphate oxidase family protein [Parafrankia elaeagni]|uniref:pyridoxamine 5'-phosphate oxidase family protein n=1 Tax=Parafrankia elaeagni TaxID=222534 RepID=UPI00039E3965|nr:pyridoxamine 5'-phosphate oxidase family protein [Parafrankia elaeagni]
MREQRRGRKIAMTQEEVDAFLAEERTCRVATTSPSGPHLTPLWFVWDGQALWLNSVVRSQRWTDLERDPRVAVVIDTGHGFGELRGVEIRGRAESVGEAPRTSTPDPGLANTELLYARKYTGRDEMHYDGRHAWLRVVPEKISSWDFRKM